MNYNVFYVGLLFIFLISACTPDNESEETTPKEVEVLDYLPLTSITLNNLNSFAKTSANWQISGGVYVDRSKDKVIEVSSGSGILVNNQTDDAKEHLFTQFDHGDIELEFDVMMPKGSNSGVYFQGRYEIQLLDSWGVKEPTFGDIGGIYQRWDEDKPKGQEGYEGHPPKINAAKAPGLWQHFKVIFHAPKFDETGKKIKNAWFEEVWLNGVLIHQNTDLTGPTRGAAFKDEVARAPLMIQGDHGPVAFKNIQYKLYDGSPIQFKNMTLKEFERVKKGLPDFSTVEPKQTLETDSISIKMATMDKFCLLYQGEMDIQEAGTYLFDLQVGNSNGILIIDKDTVLNLKKEEAWHQGTLATIDLAKGAVPFALIYDRAGWNKKLELFAEGPHIQKHPLHIPEPASEQKVPPSILVNTGEEPTFQRGFLMHQGKKLTHTISVATPEGIHYAYNLANGALLQVWGGDFLDATQMWFSRGTEQLGVPLGAVVDFYGQPNIISLDDANAPWPDTLNEAYNFRTLGYELDEQGLPIFLYESQDVNVRDQMMPSKEERRFTRKVEIEGSKKVWLKIDEGTQIQKLKDGSYAVNAQDYFVEIKNFPEDKILIRSSQNKEELLLELDKETRTVQYDIIW